MFQKNCSITECQIHCSLSTGSVFRRFPEGGMPAAYSILKAVSSRVSVGVRSCPCRAECTPSLTRALPLSPDAVRAKWGFGHVRSFIIRHQQAATRAEKTLDACACPPPASICFVFFRPSLVILTPYVLCWDDNNQHSGAIHVAALSTTSPGSNDDDDEECGISWHLIVRFLSLFIWCFGCYSRGAMPRHGGTW